MIEGLLIFVGIFLLTLKALQWTRAVEERNA